MNRIARMLKSSRILYSLYFYVMSFFLKLLGVFVGFDNRLILFNCFGGKKYDDSPKVIYERMLLDSRFDDYKFVWALQNPKEYDVPGRATVIKADTIKYFVSALRAKLWITNSSMERGLDFKKRKTICLNTWHGTAIKLMGVDIKNDNKSFKSKVLVRADVMLAQSRYDVETFSHCFQIPEQRFRLTGLPRNDILANFTHEQVKGIRTRLGLDPDKIVLLYAPTFREYSRGASNEVVLETPLDVRYWQSVLGNRFVVLFRAHYEVAKHLNVGEIPMFIDVSAYPDLNDLMIASDALISDYSSIFFDYSVMHKPMYCFAYDYDMYISHRGTYLDLKEELPCTIHYDEKTLVDSLLHFEEERDALSEKTCVFQKKYVTEYGCAAQKICNELISLLEGKGNR